MQQYIELRRLCQEQNITLVAVSKTQPLHKVKALYDAGQRIFAENRVQDLLERYEALPKDIEWHLIGNLQTNKVKYIASFIGMIQSVDSLRLLQEINKHALKHGRTIDCLLEFHVAQELSKHGFNLSEAQQMLASDEYRQLSNVRICGIMGMATFTDNQEFVHKEFGQLREIFEQLRKDFFAEQTHFRECSMGMSSDYRIAIAEGSTMLRVGTLLFS